MRRESGRRAELLALSARLFAERGYVSTTVRDIADAAGILSGSLYHHFDSKEAMVDEILRDFLGGLFHTYTDIVSSDLGPRKTIEAMVQASFQAIHEQPHAVAIYQNESQHLAQLERFSYLKERNEDFRNLWRQVLSQGAGQDVFRADFDIDVVYRFIRDTVWVAVAWYNPTGRLSADDVAQQYLGIVLDGIANKSGRTEEAGDAHV